MAVCRIEHDLDVTAMIFSYSHLVQAYPAVCCLCWFSSREWFADLLTVAEGFHRRKESVEKKYPLPGANWDSCSGRAGGPQPDESPCSPALGAQTAYLQGVGAHPGLLDLCKPAVFLWQSCLLSALHLPMPTLLPNF